MEEARMELNVDEQRALAILLRCRELERESKLVSKARHGEYPCELLTQKLTEADKFRLEFIPGPEGEIREQLARLSIYARVLSDLQGVDLVDLYERAAVKIREKGLIPRLVLSETLGTGIETTVSGSKPSDEKPLVDVEELLEQLRA